MKNKGLTRALAIIFTVITLLSLTTNCTNKNKSSISMDLKLDVDVQDLVHTLSHDSQDSTFLMAMEIANKRKSNNEGDFITLFGEAFKEIDPNYHLAYIFFSELKNDNITVNSTNDEVLKVLREKSDEAIDRSYKILRTRIDRFGVAQPNIQKIGNTGRILVELPGVKDAKRVRKLLTTTGNLEIWETYFFNELATNFEEANAQTSLFNYLIPSYNLDENNNIFAEQIARIGIAQVKDTAEINMKLKETSYLFPRNMKLVWTAKPYVDTNGIEYFELIPLKGTHDTYALDGSVITDARQDYGQDDMVEVSFKMNNFGTKKWKYITSCNIGRQIAIVIDNYVYSCPIVNDEISNGRCTISSYGNNLTVEEAKDLATILNSGELPVSLHIIEETVTAPYHNQATPDSNIVSYKP